MPLTIVEDSFFKSSYELKYLTAYDPIFKISNQRLKFYPGTSLYIVNVDISASSDLQEEDITITTGIYHNATDIVKKIRDKTDLIYEMCKTSRVVEFVLDLNNMKVIEKEDFIAFLPRYGLNTLFIFEDVPYSKVYSLVNPTKNIKDSDIYAWFISYIYSSIVCLIPKKILTNYSIRFFQALSLLASNGGNKNNVKLTKDSSVLRCVVGNCGMELSTIPGDKTDRFEKLILSSMDQMTKHKNKSKK